MAWPNEPVTRGGKRRLGGVIACVIARVPARVPAWVPACGVFLVAWGLWGLILAQTEENRVPVPDRDAVGGRVAEDHARHGQSSASIPDSRAFSRAQRVRIRKLEERITCACPKENWSRTLAHCPDACADPQKDEIRAAIVRGMSDSEILEEQKQRHGVRALAQPGWSGGGKWTYVLPIGICLVAVVVTLAVLSMLVRRRRADAVDPPESNRASDAELAALEQELSELDD